MKRLSHKSLLDPYKDQYGFIGHKTDEGGLEFGDGTQRLGTCWITNFLLYRESAIENSDLFADQLDRLLLHTIDKNGKSKLQYIRHWNGYSWPGQPWIMSRDNFEALWTACELIAPYNERVKKHLDLMTKLVTKRLGFVWNYRHIWPQLQYEPKLPGAYWPWDWLGKLIRKNRAWYLWIILVVLDLDSVVNSLLRIRASYRDMTDTSNDLNHQIKLVYRQVIYWTPTIWIAKMLYRYRGISGVNGKRFDLGGKNAGALSAFMAYFWGPKNPPIAAIWKPVIDKYL